MKHKFKKTRLSFDERVASSKFEYCKNLKWFMIPSIVIVLVGIILFCTIGFNLGTDFTGGSIMTVYVNHEQVIEDAKAYDVEDSGDYAEIQNKINEVLGEFGLTGNTFQTTTIDIDELNVYEGQAVLVKYQNVDGQQASEILATNESIQKALLEKFGYGDMTYTVTNGGTVTPSASNELLMNSFIAMLVALALIIIYVAIRFEITSGIATILALFHDLLITTSFVLMFRITVNAAFIAALVTILGYSINNTVIIFDRIRENQKSGKYEGKPNSVVADVSVKETITRSVFTTLTTFVTIALVAIIGVADIRDFALPIGIGILSGFYSSIFITPGLWAIAYNGKKRRKKIKQTENQDKLENTEKTEEIAG